MIYWKFHWVLDFHGVTGPFETIALRNFFVVYFRRFAARCQCKVGEEKKKKKNPPGTRKGTLHLRLRLSQHSIQILEFCFAIIGKKNKKGKINT